jgi:phospholipid N-methyltransferase
MNLKEVQDFYNAPVSKIYRKYDYFIKREKSIATILQDSVRTSVLDIGAGDAFWIKYFIDLIDSYTAIESGKDNCRMITNDLNLTKKKTIVINADAFYFDYKNICAETVFFGFFISHFPITEIVNLLKKIKQNVAFNRILILDSYWSEYRKNKFITNELKSQKRIINPDGKIIEVPKRFISVEDLQYLSSAMEMHLEIKFTDEYWCCALLKKEA